MQLAVCAGRYRIPGIPGAAILDLSVARRAAKSSAYSRDGKKQGQGSPRALLMPPVSGSGLREHGPELFNSCRLSWG